MFLKNPECVICFTKVPQEVPKSERRRSQSQYNLMKVLLFSSLGIGNIEWRFSVSASLRGCSGRTIRIAEPKGIYLWPFPVSSSSPKWGYYVPEKRSDLYNSCLHAFMQCQFTEHQPHICQTFHSWLYRWNSDKDLILALQNFPSIGQLRWWNWKW